MSLSKPADDSATSQSPPPTIKRRPLRAFPKSYGPPPSLAGPSTAKELYNWADFGFQRLQALDTGVDRMATLKQNALKGINLWSFYSGKGADGTVATHLNQKFVAEGMVPKDVISIRCVHASDISPTCVRVLTGLKKVDGTPLYDRVFGDMMLRYQQAHLDHLQTLAVAAGLNDKAVNPVVAKEAYYDMLSYLTTTLPKDLYTMDDNGEPAGYCHIAERSCCFYKTNDEHGAAAADAGDGAPAFKRMRSGYFEEPKKKWSLWVAGTCCEDWSRYGSRMGPAGQKMKEFMSFCCEVHHQRPTIVLAEISDTAPVTLYSDNFPKEYYFMSGVLTPQRMGWPARRARRYTVAWDSEQCDFSGSWDEFDRCFSCYPTVTSKDILFATPKQRADYRSKLANRRGHFLPSGCMPPLELCLTAQEFCRLMHARTSFANLKKETGCKHMLTDLEQNPGYVANGEHFPPLVRHGKLILIDDSDETLLTPLEHLSVMGEGVLQEQTENGYAYPLAEFLKMVDNDKDAEKFSGAQLRSLAGGAMHMVNLGTLMLYALACAEPLKPLDDTAFDLDMQSQ